MSDQQILLTVKGIGTHQVEIPIIDLPSNDDLAGPEPSAEMISELEANRFPNPAPIMVVAEGDDLVRYRVLDGRRRIKAQRRVLAKAKRENDTILMNNLFTIPAVVIEGDSFDLERNALSANFNRSSNPVTEVQTILGFIHERNMTVESIALQCNLDKKEVAKRAKFTGLMPSLLQLFYTGRMAFTVAEAALKLSHEMQTALLLDYRDRLVVNDKARISADDVKRFRDQNKVDQMAQLALSGMFDEDEEDDGFSVIAKPVKDSLKQIYSDLQSFVMAGEIEPDDLADIAERIRAFI